jgi:hypothetical protein
LRLLATALAIVYVAWNVVWLVLFHCLPPSLLLALTGLPAPTTGMTRSLLCLCRADFRQSFLWNAMALPMALLFAVCLLWILFLAVGGRKVVLPQWVLHCWGAFLIVAWVGKFAFGPAYW